jgi:hypothetical protein
MWIGAGVQKDVGHLVACVVGGEHEWGHTKLVGSVDVGTRTDQQPRRGEIVPVNGPRNGRRAIGLRSIHVDLPSGKQGSDSVVILLLDRIRQTGVLNRGSQAECSTQGHTSQDRRHAP